MSRKDTLPDEIKVYIVQQLAAYVSPGAVAKAVKEEFGVEISRQAVEYYDPGKKAGANLVPRYREMFAAARTKFKTDVEDVPLAHKAARLAILTRLALKAEAAGNIGMVKDLLEQAAKEMGGAYAGRGAGEQGPQQPDDKPGHPGDEHLAALREKFSLPLRAIEGGKAS